MTRRRSKLSKAYSDPRFIASRDARPVRILAEYLEPLARFEHFHIRDTIVFFGSARALDPVVAAGALERARAERGDVARAERALRLSAYYAAARELARRLTEWSKGLTDKDRRFVICTGGGPGIMEAASRGASEAKGVNIGLTISLPNEEFENPYVTRELAFEFHYFFIRKFWFTYLAKAVVVMPGGFGTLDELFELLTLVQTLKIQKRMPVAMFGAEYWDQVINFDTLVEWGTIDAADSALFHRTDSVDDAFQFITRELTE
ncbi:MAG TPA: LOG family protein, partial [Alphaproteobacteria bacterium]